MGSPEADKIRDEARERIAGRPTMVLDGDPVEELAKAHDRHAARLEAIVRELRFVGRENHLGNTSEGEAATHNIVVAVHDHERSVVKSTEEQASRARYIAGALRQIGADLTDTEVDNQHAITAAAR
ncbi:hypothetical protein [Tsukamurella sp. PLM1]|uniref:hypothetical protein n=1 Tax=Tsukamurella sp. PLM1 TaxID=2929795 RepID=UPI0020539837|nr:hypothetical protein [Tsukamurella sp. PLM1]BDH58198.1 hypothetical protein MTP03_31370 [Tsukamurella sp. PLM1]